MCCSNIGGAFWSTSPQFERSWEVCATDRREGLTGSDEGWKVTWQRIACLFSPVRSLEKQPHSVRLTLQLLAMANLPRQQFAFRTVVWLHSPSQRAQTFAIHSGWRHYHSPSWHVSRSGISSSGFARPWLVVGMMFLYCQHHNRKRI